MILLQLSDFKGGKYDIPDAGGVYTKVNVQEMIDKYEKQYIYELIGVVEGDKFIAWVQTTPTPVNADYTKILNAFSADNSSSYPSGLIQSLGMKEYLKAGVFYQCEKNGLLTSQAGVTKPESETATQQNPSSTMRFAENKFNDVLDTIEAIQWYCTNNSTAFPEYNGKFIPVKYANFL